MRHKLLAALLVAMTGCGSDTKPEDQPKTPAETASQKDQPTAPEETVSSPETPNGSDEPSAKAVVPVVNSIGMRFVPIQAGTFTMGEEHYSQKAHQVTLTQAFELGVYEVTQEQYEAVMGTNPSSFEGPQNPVEKVSSDDAVEFCRKLSELPAEKKAGYVYRLPTEAEWEYACRAGTKTTYSFGDSDSGLGEYAWYDKNSGNTTHPVGGKKPNPWGLYDMHGNVWEWCQDWHGYYPSGSVTDPTGAASGSYRVLRGGSFPVRTSLVRSAYRKLNRPDNLYNSLGFRPARTYILSP
jgi:formylglycine-generating enzyme required for sulfatase activity